MTFCICWGWGCAGVFIHRMGDFAQQFLFAPQFLAGPQTHIAVMDALFSCSVFLRLEQMAGAKAIGFSSTGIIAMPGNVAAKCCPREVALNGSNGCS